MPGYAPIAFAEFDVSAFAISVLVLALAVPIGPIQVQASVCRNGFYLVHDKKLRKFDEFGELSEPVASLSKTVNAMGFLSGQEILIGLSGNRVVTIDAQGSITDRGAAPSGTANARAAAVSGSRWLVLSDGVLVAVDPSSLAVTSRVHLSAFVDVDDFDVNPGDGKLYGLATGLLQTHLVRIDPATGQVAFLFSFGLLPLLDRYGSVAIDMRGTMHALHNGSGRMFHVPLNNPSRFSVTNLGLSSGTSDAAGCPVEWDYSTAPPSYGTARHTTTNVGDLTLSAQPPSVAAGATSFGVDVSVTNTTGRPAQLAAWHDLDLDGKFGAGELMTATVSTSTIVPLRWPQVAVGATGNQAWLRLRLYGRKPSSVQPAGSASGGGVQDYPIRIIRPPAAGQPPIQPPPQAPSQPQPTAPIVSPPVSPSESASPPVPGSPMPRGPRGIVDAQQRKSPRLPVTLSLFIGMLIPAIVVATRGAARRRRRSSS